MGGPSTRPSSRATAVMRWGPAFSPSCPAVSWLGSRHPAKRTPGAPRVLDHTPRLRRFRLRIQPGWDRRCDLAGQWRQHFRCCLRSGTDRLGVLGGGRLFLAGNICVVPALLLGHARQSVHALGVLAAAPSRARRREPAGAAAGARLEVGAAVATAVLACWRQQSLRSPTPRSVSAPPALSTVLRLALLDVGVGLAAVLV